MFGVELAGLLWCQLQPLLLQTTNCRRWSGATTQASVNQTQLTAITVKPCARAISMMASAWFTASGLTIAKVVVSSAIATGREIKNHPRFRFTTMDKHLA
jgi:hypothetical protein